MAPGGVWVVPGAPLPGGAGWRIWYSQPGTAAFAPAEPEVTLAGVRQDSVTTFDLFEETKDLDRRMGVATVTLAEPAAPGAEHDIAVPEAERAFRWRSLPSSLDGGVSFLMSSCFWRNDDDGHYAAAVAHLTKKLAPAFKLLMGDQLYQDYPPRTGFLDSPHEIYGDRYVEYWRDPAYRRVLAAQPNFFACDDHEFWNNYPARWPLAPWTLTEKRRDSSKVAARELLHRFQVGANPEQASFFDFQVGRVSFFVADTRSDRTTVDDGRPGFFLEAQWDALEAWAAGLEGPGALVLPQPLFHEKGGRTDSTLANFAGDHARLCEIFERALAAPRPHDIVVLTGDIHTGRHSVGSIRGVDGGDVHEFVASCVSLVGPFALQVIHQASQPPGKLQPVGRPSWTVEMTRGDGSPTIDNNVGHVRMSEGRNGRVLFELELWCVRPFTARRLAGPSGAALPYRIFRKEIELR